MSFPEHARVTSASLLGVVTPGVNLFLDGVEPVLKIILLVAQIAVAICSALYVYSKFRKVRNQIRTRTRK
jgi:hypothetical protein